MRAKAVIACFAVGSLFASGSAEAGSICEGGSGVADYCVYPVPIEAPHFTTPLPPGDGREMVTAPWLDAATASPLGWHDTDGQEGAEHTITRGNNAYVFDSDEDPDFSPDGGPNLIFNFPVGNVDGDDPLTYRSASITQVFYWLNVLHDVLYEHGFDEAAGNFQENNYGNGGAGGDAFEVEVQWDLATCAGSFGSAPDGTSPLVRVTICNLGGAVRDVALDNGVVSYLYWLGVSERLVAGPNNVLCQNNDESPRVGWSDFGALLMTLEEGDAGADRRPFGTWFLGQSPDGDGAREFPYSTDLTVDPRTYGDLSTRVVPFDTGSIWAAVLWEMAWALIEGHGFNPNLYEDWTTGGNNLALKLVLDGMALLPCNPGFVDSRDAILQAELNLTGGVNQCRLWSAFAKRGLGVSANQGSSQSSVDGTAAFDLPLECGPIFADGFESGDTSAWN